MEMSEEIYANVEITEDNRADSSDSEHSYEDVHGSQDNVKTKRPRSFKQSESSGTGIQENRMIQVIMRTVWRSGSFLTGMPGMTEHVLIKHNGSSEPCQDSEPNQEAGPRVRPRLECGS
ncbi:C-type lectin domain family 4 member E-like isoform X1 [Clarias magur]|uniref:C-type lectin domain family 4 member E-like isoform X1 n=1 Tax=Clarias magur TaxID=1594786 RepID=A0A8J4UG01_CLAMG|nr:C-type lectin domain family 4 member E-like isoform X1 [Clarias magur]